MIATNSDGDPAPSIVLVGQKLGRDAVERIVDPGIEVLWLRVLPIPKTGHAC